MLRILVVGAIGCWSLSALGDAPAEPPAAGLILWLDALDAATVDVEDGGVARWRNKAPGAAHALRSEPDRRPRYVPRPESLLRPAVRFDGRDDVLCDLAFGRRMACWTLVLMAAPYSGGGGLCSGRSLGGHDYDPGFTVDLYASGARFDQVSVEGAGRIGGQQDQMHRDYAYGGLHVIVVERAEREIRLYVDGVPEGVRPVNPAETTVEELRVGARWYAGQERAFFDGEIAEVLLYDRVLEPEERKALERSRAVSPEERRKGEEDLSQMNQEREKNQMKPPEVLRAWPTIAAYENWRRADAGSTPWTPVAQLPIRTDLRNAIVLCARHLNALYDVDRDDEPFFYANLRSDGTGEMHHSVNIGIPHVVGRCLIGGMMAERLAEVPFDARGLSVLERYLRSSFDNPDDLNSYFDPAKGNTRFVEFHNMREGLYGLWALVTGRQSAWAQEKAHAMLETLEGVTDEDGRWSVERARELGTADLWQGLATPNAARMVDPLLAYHRATGDALALRLAGLYARAGLSDLFEDDGRFAPVARSSGHVHSITSSLSGITDYALFTADEEMLAACRLIMDVGVPEYHSSWGWGDEVFPDHPADVVSRGEINQTGDVVRTALLLGEAGYPAYYERAERYLRGMLLPTQHREEELRRFMRDNVNPTRDAERDVLARTVGGYSMQLPNDRMREGDWPLSTLDITSGATHALCECWRHRVTAKESGCFVNLLFDCDHEDVTIRSDLPTRGRIAFAMKSERELCLRVPNWVAPASLELHVNGEVRPVRIECGYLRTGTLDPGDEGTVEFAVPCKVEGETVDGIEYTTTWVGNQVIEILPRGRVSPLPF